MSPSPTPTATRWTVLSQHLMGGLMPLGTFPVGTSPRAVVIGQFDGV
jgi:hypothetical protein